MFNINYETAKAEVARRHERLHEAQRSGYAFEPRTRRSIPAFFAAIVARFGRKASAPAAPPVTASGDPCLTC